MKCRHCSKFLKTTFLDLGFAPPSNAYLISDKLKQPEKYYPLNIKVCTYCWLVQTEDYAQTDELFSSDYAYFSSTSISWLEHAKNYAKNAITQLGLTKNSHVIEIASNDGYLLKNFVEVGIPCLGIEPTASTAAVAKKLGIPVLQEFFGERLARYLAYEGKQADLLVGNNVYAHVPDINDFTRGLKLALKPGGTLTLEFPHFLELLKHNQFDTMYHEHFSYLSLYTVSKIFKASDLRVWNVEKLSTHGGSLRVYGCHTDDLRQTNSYVNELLAEETQFGLQNIDAYNDFQFNTNKIKDDLVAFLIEKKRIGKKVVAYGAAAKGNTLLNYAGIKADLLPFVGDAASAKQGKFMPGSHIPILPPSALVEFNPDFVLILPWNLAKEIHCQLLNLLSKDTQFVIALPTLKTI